MGRSYYFLIVVHYLAQREHEHVTLAFPAETTEGYYFKTADELAADFAGRDDALRRTFEVAERCNVEIEAETNYGYCWLNLVHSNRSVSLRTASRAFRVCEAPP